MQSAYRAGHSTETALIKVKADILNAINNKEVVCLVLLDLLAAFDTVDHQIILERLKIMFGLTGTVYQLDNFLFVGETSKGCSGQYLFICSTTVMWSTSAY